MKEMSLLVLWDAVMVVFHIYSLFLTGVASTVSSIPLLLILPTLVKRVP